MEDFKGTKGQWIIRHNGSYYEVNREEDFRDGKRLAVTVMVFDVKDEECVFNKSGEDKANAQLIATAPELLTVLLKVQKAINEMDYSEIEGLYDEVEETINKSLGKENSHE